MNLLSTLIPWPYRLLALALLAAVLLGFGYVKGLQHAAADAAKSDSRALQSIIKIERKQQAVSASVATAHEAQREKTRIVYRTIDKEVIKYVQASSPAARFRLDAGWVRLHDAAALSRAPGAPGESDAQPTRFTAADGLATVAGNYETCTETRQQLTDLQRWITEQRAAWMP